MVDTEEENPDLHYSDPNPQNENSIHCLLLLLFIINIIIIIIIIL